MDMSYDQIQAQHAALTAAAAAGTLTRAGLSAAIRLVVFDPSDGPAESIGTDWIRHNISIYAKVVDDPGAFLQEHLDVPEFSRAAISRPEMLVLLPTEQRISLVHEAYVKNGAWSGWEKIAIVGGIDRSMIAQMISDRLEQSTADADLRYNTETPVHAFLRYGAGDESSPNGCNSFAPWPMFNTKQFAAVIRLCATKSPRSVLAERTKLSWRLDSKTLEEICVDAASRLTSTSGLTLAHLKQLPLASRVALCMRLETESNTGGTAAELIFDTMTLHADMAGAMPVLDKIGIVMLYRHASKFPNLPSEVKRYLTDRLAREGYLVGALTRGTFTPRGKTQPTTQLQLVFEDSVYVPHRWPSGKYYPEAGHQVIVKMGQGTFLTRRDGKAVYATNFTPVDPTIQTY